MTAAESSSWSLNGIMKVVSHWLKSMNPTLLEKPPAFEEVTGRDVCYLGPNGSEARQDLIYCKDLADGMRSSVGSWYLSPERHVTEYIIVTILCLLLLAHMIPTLGPYERPSPIFFHDQTTPIKPSHPPLRPPLLLKLITGLCCTLMITYKYLGYEGKMYYLVMPCNMNWFLAFWLCFVPGLSTFTAHVILQSWLCLSSLAVVALVTPDTNDLVLPGEILYFFANHVVLALVPWYFLFSGQISTLPPSSSSKSRQTETVWSFFWKWTMVTFVAFALFYVAVVTPLAIYSGMNLNYMLSPPSVVAESNVSSASAVGQFMSGPNYRVASAVIVAMTFTLMRFIMTVVEWLVRTIVSSNISISSSSSSTATTSTTSSTKCKSI